MKIALAVEYDGALYHGWQRQSHAKSVQAELEKALSQIAQHPIELFCAGRTDAGVHATGQIVHFETTAQRDLKAWTLGTNALLPSDIAVRFAKEVDTNFHARFSAQARRYCYVIYNRRLRSAILPQGLTHYYHLLDEQKMHQAAQCLIGEHDFSSFRSAQCQSHSPNRNIHFVQVSRIQDYVLIDIQANAFLHHMVRNIVGSLCLIGQGDQPVAWLTQLLAQKDRTKAGATAKPNGLYLTQVIYPAHFAMPVFDLPIFNLPTAALPFHLTPFN